MKIMKHLVSVLLCLALVVVVVAATNSSFADSAAHATIKVDNQTVYVGDTIKVTFYAPEDGNVTTLTGGIRFNTEYLTCTAVDLAQANGNRLLNEVDLSADSDNKDFRMVVVSTPEEANANGQVGFASVGTEAGNYTTTDLYVATFEIIKTGTFDVIAYEDSHEGIKAAEVHRITITAKEAPAGLRGDIDLDGDVDIDDVVALMRHTLQAEIITDATALANGEVTGDESLDIDDVVKIMQYVLKAIDSLD